MLSVTPQPPLTTEFEDQMIQLVNEQKGGGKYKSVHHPDEQGATDDAPNSTTLMLLVAKKGVFGEIVIL